MYDTAVRKCCTDLTQFMKPSILLPALVEGGVFTLEEAADIIRLPAGHTAQCLILLEKVASKGRGGYSALFQALRDESQHIPHHELWEALVQKCEGRHNYVAIQVTRTLAPPPPPPPQLFSVNAMIC